MSVEVIEAEVPATELPLSLVLYGDGGCQENPGPAGWGLHGYFFNSEVPKKGAGQNTNVLTSTGYELKANNLITKEPHVTPVKYVDAYGGFSHIATNNIGELTAFLKAAELAISSNVKSLHYMTDSKYVVEGFKSHMPKWIKNKWLKSDGNPPANIELWHQAAQLQAELLAKDITLTMQWVKGHSGDLGNEASDQMATAGGIASSEGYTTPPYQNFALSEADGYWKTENNRHPLLAYTSMYFTTAMPIQTDPERNFYYVGEHDQEDNSEFLGKEIAEGAHAVICLKEPDPVLGLLRQRAQKDSNGHDLIMVAKLATIYRPDTFKQFCNYKTHAFFRSHPKRLNYKALDRVEIMMEKQPAGLAYRALDVLVMLEELLVDIRANNTANIVGYTETDLTPMFFEKAYKINNKLNKIIGRTSGPTLVSSEDPFFATIQQLFQHGSDEMKALITEQDQFSKDFKPGINKIMRDVNYTTVDGEIKQEPIGLYFGVDFPTRNAIKRMEELNPKVKLISWRVAPKVLRYVTYFECSDGYGICGGMYTNTRVIIDAPTS